jgi:peptidoglycan hydrolase CwlO-like protein
MKKTLMAIIGLTLMAGTPLLVFAEMHEMSGKHGKSEFCEKHCKVEKLTQQVTDLTKEIEATKASAKQPGSDKITSLMARQKEAASKVKKQMDELTALQAELDKANKALEEVEAK